MLPAYKYSQPSMPFVVDLVEDNVRNRCIFPIVALALYITLVFQLTDAENAVNPPLVPLLYSFGVAANGS